MSARLACSPANQLVTCGFMDAGKGQDLLSSSEGIAAGKTWETQLCGFRPRAAAVPLLRHQHSLRDRQAPILWKCLMERPDTRRQSSP